MTKRILLAIDFQNDFVTGTMKIDKASEVCRKFKEYLLGEAKDRYAAIIFSLDSHPWNHSSFVEYGGPFPSHCVNFSAGAALNDDVVTGIFSVKHEGCDFYMDMEKGERVRTDEFSALGSKTNRTAFTTIYNAIRKKASEVEIDVAGIASEYCVLETVKDLVGLGYKECIRILKDYIVDMGNPEKLLEYARKNELVIH